MILQRYLSGKGERGRGGQVALEIDLFRHICIKVFALVVS